MCVCCSLFFAVLVRSSTYEIRVGSKMTQHMDFNFHFLNGTVVVYDRTTETNRTETGIGSVDFTETTDPAETSRNNRTYRNLPKQPILAEPTEPCRNDRYLPNLTP